MEVNVGTTSIHWNARHAVFPHSLSSSQTLARSKRRRHRRCEDSGDVTSRGSLACHYPSRPISNSSAFLGTQSAKLHRSKSCEFWEFSKANTTMQKHNPIRRVCSASSDFFSGEFSNQIQELALQFRIAGEEEDERKNKAEIIHESAGSNGEKYGYGKVELLHKSVSGLDSMEPPWLEMENHCSFLRKANSVELPHSLRIIRRKLQEERLKGASESTYCSVNRAFSSMVFMVEELNSFTLQMREASLCEDLEGIVQRVKKDMHASFLWLFQHIFSHSPTLMVSVMLLLANFTVHSMGLNTAIASDATLLPPDETVEASPIGQTHSTSCSLKTASIVGGDGEDGKGWVDRTQQCRLILPNGVSHSTRYDKSNPEQVIREEESRMWNSMVEEAERMQDSAVDNETGWSFVAPIDVKIEPDDYDDYVRTEVLYEMCLSEDPTNPMLLANLGQFHYLVTRDYDRAEEYFKRATWSETGDAEAWNKYANFLWRARKDLCAAEENFLEAISIDPTNPFYAANYANFLWNTGGEDTCFPLGSP